MLPCSSSHITKSAFLLPLTPTSPPSLKCQFATLSLSSNVKESKVNLRKLAVPHRNTLHKLYVQEQHNIINKHDTNVSNTTSTIYSDSSSKSNNSAAEVSLPSVVEIGGGDAVSSSKGASFGIESASGASSFLPSKVYSYGPSSPHLCESDTPISIELRNHLCCSVVYIISRVYPLITDFNGKPVADENVTKNSCPDITTHNVSSANTDRPLCISGFSPIGSECPFIGTILSYVYGLGHNTALPVSKSTDEPLHFYATVPGEKLIKGKYNIPCPPSSLEGLSARVIPDLIFVPLLAFDRLGGRVGYGAGYYDRTISKLRRSYECAMRQYTDQIFTPTTGGFPTVDIVAGSMIEEAGLLHKYPVFACGIAYSGQEVTCVPVDAYDELLDAVLTEKELIIVNQHMLVNL